MTRPTIPIQPLGDRGCLASFPSEADAAGWAHEVRKHVAQGVLDVVVAYRTVGVHADPDLVDLDQLAETLANIPALARPASTNRTHRVPTLYDGEDLDLVARQLGLTRDAVVFAHSRQEYRVLAVGFLPGFPYLGDLPANLQGTSRRDSPRPRVPAGSVAIVGKQTAVYPSESPGGWHLIGRTPLQIVDTKLGRFPIAVGDRVRFVEIDPAEYQRQRGARL